MKRLHEIKCNSQYLCEISHLTWFLPPKIEVQKLAEEITRIDYSCTTQEHELKTLSDHMCDLNSLKESVRDHNDEIAIIKEDYTRMKSHLNVSAKLELQTQERMYESRLLHLENGEKYSEKLTYFTRKNFKSVDFFRVLAHCELYVY